MRKHEIRQQYTSTGNKMLEHWKCVCVTTAYRAIKKAKITAVELEQRDTAARIQYCHWFCSFVLEGVRVWYVRMRFECNTLYKEIKGSKLY
jgi:hypothetical protein